MNQDLFTNLVPIYLRPWEKDRFDLFEVMHHGTHEKQLSNVFAWLLRADASHRMDDAFSQIFIDEINRAPGVTTPFKYGSFSVMQEVNTREDGKGDDIADIVLIGQDATIVVENFGFSDGHGHKFRNYSDYGERAAAGGRSAVVLLCEVEDEARVAKSKWENAVVVTYERFLRGVCNHVDSIADYSKHHPAQHAFFEQLRSHFLEGDKVNDEASIEFVAEICRENEATIFGQSNHSTIEEAFGERMKDEAILRLRESREMLSRVKRELKRHAEGPLRTELAERRGRKVFDSVLARWQGRFQWSVLLQKGGDKDENTVGYLLFGPTAWLANSSEVDGMDWIEHTVPNADYSHVFLVDVATATIKQSTVRLSDVLAGLGESAALVDEFDDFLGK